MGATVGAIARNPQGAASLIILGLLLVACLFADTISPYAPDLPNLGQRLLPPSSEHVFGTDHMGRDLFSRVVHGARVSLPVGFAIVVTAGLFGSLAGMLAGFFGGWYDEVIMRTTDAFLCFPPMVLAIAVAAALGPGLTQSMLALGVVWWPSYCRIARAQVLASKESEYVEAAVALGATWQRVLFKHVAPNLLAPLLVHATLDLGYAVLASASLSFIGLGAQPPMAEWGSMITDGRSYVLDYWWFPTFPGLAIFVTVLAFNMLGDAIRDYSDPLTREVR